MTVPWRHDDSTVNIGFGIIIIITIIKWYKHIHITCYMAKYDANLLLVAYRKFHNF